MTHFVELLAILVGPIRTERQLVSDTLVTVREKIERSNWDRWR